MANITLWFLVTLIIMITHCFTHVYKLAGAIASYVTDVTQSILSSWITFPIGFPQCWILKERSLFHDDFLTSNNRFNSALCSCTRTSLCHRVLLCIKVFYGCGGAGNFVFQGCYLHKRVGLFLQNWGVKWVWTAKYKTFLIRIGIL